VPTYYAVIRLELVLILTRPGLNIICWWLLF